MQPRLGIWKRFIPSLLFGDRFISGGQNQLRLRIWKRFIFYIFNFFIFIFIFFIFLIYLFFFSIMSLCIRARGTTVACANIKMYPIYKI